MRKKTLFTFSNSSLCDINNKGDILKLHDKSPNKKCSCQKLIKYTLKQLQIEGNGFKNTMKKIFEASQTAWNIFLKPMIKTLAPVIATAVGAKSKNKQVGQATTQFSKSKIGGKFFSLTDLHGPRIRLKSM